MSRWFEEPEGKTKASKPSEEPTPVYEEVLKEAGNDSED